MTIENLITLKDSICIECDWNEGTFDEQGTIDYCTRRGIYVNKMEGMKQCLYFKREDLE